MNKKNIYCLSILLLLLTSVLSCSSVGFKKQQVSKGGVALLIEQRPNILLIVADDLGYSDLGVYGGEIDTPNLDKLAQSGMMLTDFHTAPTCSPTRSMLLSGTDNHLAGLGSMQSYMEFFAPELLGKPGYEGHLNFQVAALPELLTDAGYHTYMTGKWHLGMEESQGPKARGFEKSYVLLEGGAGHLDQLGIMAGNTKAAYREDGQLVQLPDDFYSTHFYATKMVDYIKQNNADDKPFFGYLAFTAPHWPLQAPQKSIDKYKGKYDTGYEALFNQRVKRQKALGLIDEDTALPALLSVDKKWSELTEEQKKRSARTMEIYAAMIDDLDKYVGHVISELKAMGEYDNTLIFFMSDNGAEGGNIGNMITEKSLDICCDNSYENMGAANSYIWQGSAWARASVGASKLYKSFSTEGGILAPAFVSYPKNIQPKQQYNGFISVMDLYPTFLELAKTKHPGTYYKGRKVHSIKGASLNSVLTGTSSVVHDENYVMGWELFGSMGIRKDNWKITFVPPPLGAGQWELYNLADDPTEAFDLSKQYPEIFNELKILWENYVKENGVQLRKP